jgi:hypothetical protein
MLAKYIRYMVKNYMFAVLALLFTIVYWINAYDLPRASLVFPRALLYILVPLFIWNFVNSLRGFRKELESEKEDGTKWECGLNLTTPKVVVTLLTLAYIVIMPLLGFVVTTVLYLAALAYYLGLRKLVPLVTFTLVYIATLYAVFVVWLGVRLPNGLLM